MPAALDGHLPGVTAAAQAVRPGADGVLVQVRVTPRSRPGWSVAGDRLVVRVAAAPVEGAATDEARRAVATVLGVAPGRVVLHRGARSRTKVFAVDGVSVASATAALERAVDAVDRS